MKKSLWVLVLTTAAFALGTLVPDLNLPKASAQQAALSSIVAKQATGAITDNDLVVVRRATRAGATNIDVEVEWLSGRTGESLGVYGISWPDTTTFRDFLESQTFEDVMRAVLVQCYNQDTGALRPTVYDALQGKTFRVLQRVQVQ